MTYHKNKLDLVLLFLFSLYPIAILTGNFVINSFIITIGTLSFFKFLLKKDLFFQYKNILLLLLFFFITLIINLFFTNNIFLSYERVLKFFFVIFFIISFKFLLTSNYKNIDIVYKTWCIFFVIVLVDLMIEYFLGKNIFGQTSIMPGRLGSFTGKESVIGHYFFGFCLIFLSYLKKIIKRVDLNILIAITLIVFSFIIGERSNFIKTFIAITLFIFIVYEVNYKVKILTFFFILVTCYTVFLNLDHRYKQRYFNQVKLIFSSNGVNQYLDNSKYGAHRNVAKEIFFDNPMFGVGIKNFRVESANKIYNNLEHKKNHLRASNHPHELYYEFLSETGIFGLISFLIFIFISIISSFKNFLQYKNIYQLSALIFVLLSILPIIPTGSFLSSYSSSIFWINYALMMGYNRSKF